MRTEPLAQESCEGPDFSGGSSPKTGAADLQKVRPGLGQSEMLDVIV